jgi:L-asparaginase
MAIRILVTGGTFDKEYNEHTGQLFFKDTHIAEMLRLGRSRVEGTIRTIMMVDSLEMTDADRAIIVQNCLQSEEDRIVITHGTDTMSETAAAIARAVTGKTVVLTGAMIPYAFGSSDGLFNLGSALSFVQVLPAGVYIAMNGKVFSGTASARIASGASSRRSLSHSPRLAQSFGRFPLPGLSHPSLENGPCYLRQQHLSASTATPAARHRFEHFGMLAD